MIAQTWALSQPGARIEDVSRLLGHSTVRVTQDLYISADGDLFDRSTGPRSRGHRDRKTTVANGSSP